MTNLYRLISFICMVSLTSIGLDRFDNDVLVLKATVESCDDISVGSGYYVFPAEERLVARMVKFQRSSTRLFASYFAQSIIERQIVIDNFVHQIKPGTIQFLFEVDKVFTDLNWMNLYELINYELDYDREWHLVTFTGKVIVLVEPLQIDVYRGYNVKTLRERLSP